MLTREQREAHGRSIHTAAWAAYSRRYRAAHPLCEDCQARGIIRSVEGRRGAVDHVRPCGGMNDPLFWDPGNHRSLCVDCHNHKTAREDGGFGNDPGRPGGECGADGVPVDPRHPWVGGWSKSLGEKGK